MKNWSAANRPQTNPGAIFSHFRPHRLNRLYWIGLIRKDRLQQRPENPQIQADPIRPESGDSPKIGLEMCLTWRGNFEKDVRSDVPPKRAGRHLFAFPATSAQSALLDRLNHKGSASNAPLKPAHSSGPERNRTRGSPDMWFAEVSDLA